MVEVENIDQLSWLKGYLTAFATLSSFCYDNKTYTIELLNKANNNITDTLRGHYEVKHWIFTTEKIGRQWQDFLIKDIRKYFDQIVIEVFQKVGLKDPTDQKVDYKNDIGQKVEQLRDDSSLSIGSVVAVFVQNLKNYVGVYADLIKIEVDWNPSNAEYEGFYECYANDYIFDLGDKFLYLHFGGSD